jgi:hypothetical protein
MKQRGYDIKGNEAVMALTGVEFVGNIIPHSWYNAPELRLPIGKRETRGKPDLVAMMILADIVYWYRPIEIRDEDTGRHIGYRKKFKGEMLQRSYQAFADLFGFTKFQVADATDRLEDKALIKKHFLTVNVGGVKLGNVLFVQLFADKVIEITYPPIGIETDRHAIGIGDGVGFETDRPPNGNRQAIGLEANTNTENTPEISPEINQKWAALLSDTLRQLPSEVANEYKKAQALRFENGVMVITAIDARQAERFNKRVSIVFNRAAAQLFADAPFTVIAESEAANA